MRSTRAIRIAMLSAVLAVAVAVAVVVAGASAATVIYFQSESLPALEGQLHKHEVHAVTFHPVPAPGHIHVSMSDGRHFTVIYAVGEQARLVALAHANGVRYTVAKVKPKAVKSTHHTLRYIAGGIVVVVIIVVVAVLLVDRRRKLSEGARDSADTPAPSVSSAGDGD